MIMEIFYKRFPASRCAAGLLLIIIRKQPQQRHQQYYFVGYEGEQEEVAKQ
jgi:hypothetical protein